MAKTGKRLKKAYEGLDPAAPPMRVEEAVKQVKSRASAKFDETVEIAMNLNLDPRKQDQNLRGTVMLPHGTGKSVRVAVFARGDHPGQAQRGQGHLHQAGEFDLDDGTGSQSRSGGAHRGAADLDRKHRAAGPRSRGVVVVVRCGARFGGAGGSGNGPVPLLAEG